MLQKLGIDIVLASKGVDWNWNKSYDEPWIRKIYEEYYGQPAPEIPKSARSTWYPKEYLDSMHCDKLLLHGAGATEPPHKPSGTNLATLATDDAILRREQAVQRLVTEHSAGSSHPQTKGSNRGAARLCWGR